MVRNTNIKGKIMDCFNLVGNAVTNVSVSSSNGGPVKGADQGANQPLPTQMLESEARFYGRYPWSLEVFPKLRDIVERLRLELRHLSDVEEEWQRREVNLNIFLFCCAISESVDDFLLGKAWDFSKVGSLPLVGSVLNGAKSLLDKRRKFRERRLKRLARWRESWEKALQVFIRGFLSDREKDEVGGRDELSARDLESLLAFSLPETLLELRPRIPAAFHAQDLTHFDIVKLGAKFAQTVPDRSRPVLVVGLRTAGSYFAPVLHAQLSREGFTDVDSVSIRPKSGVGYWEMLHLQRAADKQAKTIVIDEPGGTGTTNAMGVDCVHQAGIASENIVLMVPVHPTVLDWREKSGYMRLARIRKLSLEPEEYHKHSFMQLDSAEEQLSVYFRALGYTEARIVESSKSGQINRDLRNLSEEKSQNRFKRVYEVHLRKENGEREIRFILAKSVGWGWLSYHAFHTGEKLAGFVPPVLGLRNGLLYTEWFDRQKNFEGLVRRDRVIETAASYVAARVKNLPLKEDATADLAEEARHYGSEKLVDYLSHAYGGRAISGLKRARLRHDLAARQVPCPTFIDGRMRRLEWIEGQDFIFKSDFEQHGLGKYELSITDPAYDLAEVILNFELTFKEEEQLINQYVDDSGDADVRRRLFLNKVQAATWAMSSNLINLADARLAHRHEEFHKRFTEAWDFLTIHSAHRCGSLCQRPENIRWESPVVALDIDGVVDKHVFGFPTTTIAGIQAISMLHNHGFTIVLDTARTVREVKEYCRAYGLAGGVAEYGAWAWDSISGNEVVLVTQEDREQLSELAQSLREIPGVFLNEGYRYSIRANIYGPNGTLPLPTPLIQTLMARLKVDRLQLRQTSIDTTIIARGTDKGKGLLALKALAGQEQAETITVGDTESDLPMFAVSQRSYAPGNMTKCRPVAKAMGCKVVDGKYQVGLLAIARAITHPDGGSCERCTPGSELQRAKDQDIFLKLLETADKGRMARLFSALCDPMSIKAFVK
jgi:hydroxymethylpyrimidine pyrophosphatase-like HAD family hydrolase